LLVAGIRHLPAVLLPPAVPPGDDPCRGAERARRVAPGVPAAAAGSRGGRAGHRRPSASASPLPTAASSARSSIRAESAPSSSASWRRPAPSSPPPTTSRAPSPSGSGWQGKSMTPSRRASPASSCCARPPRAAWRTPCQPPPAGRSPSPRRQRGKTSGGAGADRRALAGRSGRREPAWRVAPGHRAGRVGDRDRRGISRQRDTTAAERGLRRGAAAGRPGGACERAQARCRGGRAGLRRGRRAQAGLANAKALFSWDSCPWARRPLQRRPLRRPGRQARRRVRSRDVPRGPLPRTTALGGSGSPSRAAAIGRRS